MKTLEHGQDKIQKICDELRESTLEPAIKEAERIISDAHERAQAIIKEAEKDSENLIKVARQEISQERNVFQSSLSQSVKQSLESLKQDIVEKLFNDQLKEVLQNETSDPKVIAKVIDCIVTAIEKEGISANLSAIIPKHISEREVNAMLAQGILQKLKEHSVVLGSFNGGTQIKLNDKGLTLDITADAVKELLARFVRKDFRKLIFKEQS